MIDTLSPLIKKFLPFAQERMGFDKPPRLFLKGDKNNAKNPLGKTAYYDPDSKSITIYITGRHPKDVMRSLSHELVHHSQNCRGEFSDKSKMGEGYAQEDEHLREMEREAYEVGNMCFRDWEDSIKSTIYFEHLQKGEKKMSIKDWKNKEISGLLAEAWGFKFNTLQEFDEFNEGAGKPTELPANRTDDDLDEGAGKPTELPANRKDDEDLDEGSMTPHKARDRRTPKLQKDRRPDSEREDEEKVDENEETELEEGAFSPNHYCVHHGGVSRNGAVEMAEAVSHNFDQELGKVTHYNMKFEDGTIMENVPFEDIQVTNASLAEGHGGHKVGKKKKDDDELEEIAAKREGNEDRDVGRDRMHADRMHEEEESTSALKKEAIRNALREMLTSIKK